MSLLTNGPLTNWLRSWLGPTAALLSHRQLPAARKLAIAAAAFFAGAVITFVGTDRHRSSPTTSS
jgi:hypothetical protein